MVKQSDQEKKEICNRSGITLIEIPYWWDKKIETVAHAIHVTRPDILLPSNLQISKPIMMPQNPPKFKIQAIPYFPKKESIVSPNFDPTGW